MFTKKEETEYVLLPKSLAKEIKELNEGKKLEEVILGFIKTTESKLKYDVSYFEESITVYRSEMIKAKNSFKEAMETELDANLKVWEKYESQIPQVRDKSKKLIKELSPVKKELEEINNILKSIQTYDIENLINFIKFFNSNVYGETENILKHLMDTYKKD